MNAVFSVHEVPIRLTSERWLHIVESHDELAGRYYDVLETIVHPSYVGVHLRKVSTVGLGSLADMPGGCFLL